MIIVLKLNWMQELMGWCSWVDVYSSGETTEKARRNMLLIMGLVLLFHGPEISAMNCVNADSVHKCK